MRISEARTYPTAASPATAPKPTERSCDAPLMLTFSTRYRSESWRWVRNHSAASGRAWQNACQHSTDHGSDRGGTPQGEQAVRRTNLPSNLERDEGEYEQDGPAQVVDERRAPASMGEKGKAPAVLKRKTG